MNETKTESALIAAMKDDANNLRVTVGVRWLVWETDEWVVREQSYGKRKAVVILRTANEAAAVGVLLEG